VSLSLLISTLTGRCVKKLNIFVKINLTENIYEKLLTHGKPVSELTNKHTNFKSCFKPSDYLGLLIHLTHQDEEIRKILTKSNVD